METINLPLPATCKSRRMFFANQWIFCDKSVSILQGSCPTPSVRSMERRCHHCGFVVDDAGGVGKGAAIAPPNNNDEDVEESVVVVRGFAQDPLEHVEQMVHEM